MNISQMKIFGHLDKILNAQRYPHIKVGIGYEGEINKSKVEDNKNIIFVKYVKDNEAEKRGSIELETSKTMIYNKTIRNKQQPQVTKK